MRLRALAKINLGLDVVGKRDDGYHEVRMIMQTIQMYDVLEIEKKKEPGIVLTTNIPYVPTDERNLVYKAAYHESGEVYPGSSRHGWWKL